MVPVALADPHGRCGTFDHFLGTLAAKFPTLPRDHLLFTIGGARSRHTLVGRQALETKDVIASDPTRDSATPSEEFTPGSYTTSHGEVVGVPNRDKLARSRWCAAAV